MDLLYGGSKPSTALSVSEAKALLK